MPRRSPPPDRRIAEDALLPEELSALRQQASLLGVASDKWHLSLSLAMTWGTQAVVRIAERLRGQSDLPKDRALALAASQLGLNEETVNSRLKQFRHDSHGL